MRVHELKRHKLEGMTLERDGECIEVKYYDDYHGWFVCIVDDCEHEPHVETFTLADLWKAEILGY